VVSVVGVDLVAAEADIPHEEDAPEEIVVTVPFAQSEAETALPIGILSGEALREKVSASLGDTLKNEIGIANGSFGTGVGQPIIRGQTGNRVSILQNGVRTSDVSNLSPDHANGVEAALAERLEVIRGPSTLLYGNGALGGVINVIDNRIPQRLAEVPEFLLERSHNSVNDEDKTVVKLDASVGRFGLHFDGFRRANSDVEINGLAIDEEAVEELESLQAAIQNPGGEPEDEHEEEEIQNSRGFIANSDGEAKAGTAGFSYVGERGFLGFSVNKLSNEYGLPPGSHGHEEHEDEEEIGVEGSDLVEPEGQEFVRIDLDQTRYDVKGMLALSDRWIEKIDASLGFIDYQHSEIEIEPDGSQVVGTRFSNDGLEGRVTLTHKTIRDWTGVWGLQIGDASFSAIGEEAFIPKSDIGSIGVFAVERFNRGDFTTELGMRIDRNSVDPAGNCDRNETSTSLSSSLLYDLNDESNVLLGLSRSQRSAAVEELYSNVSASTCAQFADSEQLVSHAATGLLEIGNPELSRETANNLEIGFRKHSGNLTGEISAYYNKISDYIFLDLSGESFAGQPIARYIADDAIFKGIEAELSLTLLERAGSNLTLRLFGDLVDAELDTGSNVPRIPAASVGAALRYYGENWGVHLHTTRIMKQNDVAELELPTDAYTNLSLYADYHWELGASELQLFLRGENLLNEEMRNHASFLKNFAPEPGRSLSIGLRFRY